MKTRGQGSLRVRLVIFLALFLAVFLGSFLDWVRGPFSLLAQSSGDGLNFQILNVQINEARKPVVTFKVTTDTGSPLSLSDLDPSGGGTARFTIARLEVNGGTGLLSEWVNYIVNTVSGQPYTKDGVEMQPALASATQPGLDPVGSYSDQGDGVFVYTFTTALPEDFDRNATHRVGGQVTRSSRRWVGNDAFDFVPSGAPVTETRELIETKNCNQCHDPLAIHGGTRRETKLCVTCHTSQNTDPESGNTVDFKVMIHRIHRGAELPSVEEGKPYFIVGFNQSVHDYSEIEFPQNIRNCAKCHGEAFPHEVLPSKAACTSCHEGVNPNTGENHRPGAYSDAECFLCHEPEGREFGISLAGAHTVPQLSAQAPGVNFEIVSITDTEDGDEIVHPGHHAQVTFNIKNNAGNSIDPSTMAFLRLTLAGSTTDYSTQDYNGDGAKTPGEPIRGAPFTSPGEDYLQQDARSATPVGDGNYSLTFSLPVPQDATGTYAVGVEGYKCATISRLDQHKGGVNCTSGNTAFNEIRDAGFNVVSYFAVTDPEPVARRQVVDIRTKCVACHGAFSKNFLIHGGIRNNSEYCVLCHNPSHASLGRQPAPPVGQTDTTFPVHFKVMIHKIHTGHDLNAPYFIFGFTGNPIDVREFHFPGDTRNCEKCHLSGTNHLQPDMGLPTVTHERDSNKVVLNTFYTPPIKAACTACHDGEAHVLAMPVSTHADMWTTNPNTPEAVEECAECHGEGELLAVSRVHARD